MDNDMDTGGIQGFQQLDHTSPRIPWGPILLCLDAGATEAPRRDSPGWPLSVFWLQGPTVNWGYIGIMEKAMETAIVYWGCIGIMCYSILGLYRDNGKDNGNCYSILGLHRDNGKDNGNCYSILGMYRDNGKGSILGCIGIMENRMEQIIVCWGCIGIMERIMETTIVYWGCIGKMENRMEKIIVCWGISPTFESSKWVRGLGLSSG